MADTSTTPLGDRRLVIPCEVYSRIVGYYRPVDNWNEGKKQEFEERKNFDGSIHNEPRRNTGTDTDKD